MLIKMGLMLSVIILQKIVQSQPVIWPPGLTYLTDSTASFTWMDKKEPWGGSFSWMKEKGIKFNVQFVSAQSPLDNINIITYPEIATILPIIEIARATATHENFDTGLNHAIAHVYRIMYLNDKKQFSECYTYIWAFLAEHGRHITDMTLRGVELSLSSEQQFKLRALEAFRAGIETFLKSKYPDLCVQLACSNIHNPEKQLNALEEMIKYDRNTAMATRNQRIALLSDWHQLLLKNNIDHPNSKMEFSIKNNSSVFCLNAMHEVMQAINCPWWHAPLKYIGNTSVSKSLCAIWQYSNVLIATNNKVMHENQNTTKHLP